MELSFKVKGLYRLWKVKLGFIEANLNFGINDGEIKNNLLQIIKNL